MQVTAAGPRVARSAPSFAARPLFWSAARKVEPVIPQEKAAAKQEAARAEQAREEATRRLRASPLYGMYRYSELGSVKNPVHGGKPDTKVQPYKLHVTAELAWGRRPGRAAGGTRIVSCTLWPVSTRSPPEMPYMGTLELLSFL
jgi:hypothetical protein